MPVWDAHERFRDLYSPDEVVMRDNVWLDGKMAYDEDWFKITLNTGDTLNVLLDFVHASGDLDLALRNPAGSLVASSTSVTDDETTANSLAPAAGV